MKDIQQLIKKNSQEGRYESIFPKTFTDAVIDRENGAKLTDILAMFNMLFLSYVGSKSLTRLEVPISLRKTGIWITYVLYDKTVVTEWYAGEAIDDTSFSNDSNWRDGSNSLVGDISISSDGYWVINGEVTTIKAQGEAGITPMIRINDNKMQVSYTNGSSWNIISDYIAAWFKFTGTAGSSQADNVGKIQISRDNGATWSDLSGEFTNSLHIKGYVATVDTLPSSAVQGDIYGVGPTYDPSDTEQTNPIYQLYVKDSTGWINNGRFTSISAGVVQETGDSETEVMSQKAVTEKLSELGSEVRGAILVNEDGLYVNGDSVSSANAQSSWYIKVSKSDEVRYKITLNTIATLRIGYTESKPTIGSSVVGFKSSSVYAGDVEDVFFSEKNGYFVVSVLKAAVDDIELYNNTMGIANRISAVTKISESNQKSIHSLDNTKLDKVELGSYYVNNGAITYNSSQKCVCVRVYKDMVYVANVLTESSVNLRYGLFDSLPVNGETTTIYGNTSNNTLKYKAVKDGYLAISFQASVVENIEIASIGELSNLAEYIEEMLGKKIEVEDGWFSLSKNIGEVISDVRNSGNYKSAKVECKENDIFVLNCTAGTTAGLYVFADKNLSVIANSGLADNAGTMSDVRVIAPKNSKYLFFNDNSNSISYKGNGSLIEKIDALNSYGKSMSFETGISSNVRKTLEEVYIRKKSKISVLAKGKFRVGLGYNTYMGYWVEMDNTEVKLYKYISSTTLVETYSHGLDLSNGVCVTISAKNVTADIIITNLFGEVYVIKDVEWMGGGAPFVTNLNDTAMYSKLSYFPSDIDEDIWMFGDSYFSYWQQQRWTYWMLEYGFNKWLANHLPGISTDGIIPSFEALKKLGRPKYIVWCIGMNDASDTDENTPNEEWKAGVNKVLLYCEEHGVIPILATIPSAKNDDGSLLKYNEGKNKWIRESGHRFIDFATAVGSNSDGTWIRGLKDTDIHPTTLGAKALAGRVLLDFPEIMR